MEGLVRGFFCWQVALCLLFPFVDTFLSVMLYAVILKEKEISNDLVKLRFVGFWRQKLGANYAAVKETSVHLVGRLNCGSNIFESNVHISLYWINSKRRHS